MENLEHLCPVFTATVENSMVFTQKIKKIMHTIQQLYFLVNTQKNWKQGLEGLFIYPCSKLPLSQELRCSSNPNVHQLMMDKKTVVHTYNRLLFSLKKEWNPIMNEFTMDEPWELHPKWNKLVLDKYVIPLTWIKSQTETLWWGIDEGSLFNENLSLQDESVRKVDGGDCCITQWMYIKTTVFYIKNNCKSKFYMYFNTMKTLFKEWGIWVSYRQLKNHVLRVHKTVLYISVSFAVSYTGLLLPSF